MTNCQVATKRVYSMDRERLVGIINSVGMNSEDYTVGELDDAVSAVRAHQTLRFEGNTMRCYSDMTSKALKVGFGPEKVLKVPDSLYDILNVICSKQTIPDNNNMVTVTL